MMGTLSASCIHVTLINISNFQTTGKIITINLTGKLIGAAGQSDHKWSIKVRRSKTDRQMMMEMMMMMMKKGDGIWHQIGVMYPM